MCVCKCILYLMYVCKSILYVMDVGKVSIVLIHSPPPPPLLSPCVVQIPVLVALEQRALTLVERQASGLITRRRQDVKDQAEEMSPANPNNSLYLVIFILLYLCLQSNPSFFFFSFFYTFVVEPKT